MTEPGVPLQIVESGPSRWALVGELDLAGVPALEALLARCDGDVILDCSGLTFVDASGLDVFIRARAACETRGVAFALVRPSRCLLQLLAITGLDELLLSLTGADGSAK